MARHWCISLLLISSYLLVSTRSQSPTCSTPSEPSDSSHYINIFENMLTTDADISSRLAVAPFVQGMDVTTPAYEFAGLGTGFSVTNMSDSIRRESCTHNEITFSGRMFIRDSQSDGPLLELSYAGGLESGRVLYLLIVDAAADEIMLGYRHQGDLHTETIAPVRLISGRWRDFTITLSGNLFTFYFDCVLTVRRIVPLPDYCANDSTVVLSVASSIQGTSEYTGTTGLYVFTQDLGIHFGPGGLQRQCPSISEECPSCGQFNNVLKKLAMAQERLASLNERIKELEENASLCNTEDTSSSINCLVDDGPQQVFIENGQFRFLQNNTKICYCDNGHDACRLLGDITLSTPAPPSCPGDTTTSDQQNISPTVPPSPPAPGTACDSPPELDGAIVLVGKSIARSLGNDMCRLYSCKDEGIFGLNLEDRDHDCTTLSGECTSLSEEDQILYRCCGLCDDCSFKTCPSNSVCIIEDNPSSSALCVCSPGFTTMDGSEECVDIDECTLPFGEGGHDCPDDTSVCNNTVGSFQCNCKSGYQRSNTASICEDIDECALDSNICGENSTCTNKPGTYSCSCRPGYVEDQNGLCQAVCEPACMNGGVCSSPGNCSCPPQFSGATCLDDVNECLDPALNSCREALSCRPGHDCSTTVECVNTVGGHFCRCGRGFQEVNGICTDVDECKLRIHNCVGGASCVNTFGGFRCLCTEKTVLGVEINVVCTGRCVRNQVSYADGSNFFEKCRNCTCLGGEVTCRKRTCDCNNPSDVALKDCCSECSRRDCILSNGVRIRPGATYINVSNRCQRFNCLQNLSVVVVDHSEKCPRLDCPLAMQTTPMGKCCPVCMMPSCDSTMEGRTMSFRNGCEQCICQNSKWSCSERMECPPANCRGEDIAFYRNGCCPVCKQQVLGMGDALCPT